ncbi:hypothetical protein ACWGST_09200 [Agromyces sp. NPDC055520]
MSKPGAALAHDGDARTHVRWSSRRPLRRIAAILTSLALGAGFALVGVAAPASAHTGDLKATAVCNAETGNYDVTYTLKLSNASGKTGASMWRVGTTTFEKTPKNADGMDRGPVSSTGNETIVLGTVELAGTAKTGPWVYAYTTWNDGFGLGSDGRVENLKGDCGDSPSVKKLTICHATESDVKNPYNRITIALAAVVNGHLEHQWGEDIIPAFTYKGESYAAQGDQSLLQYEDCVKPEPKKIPVPKATFFDECGIGGYKATYDTTLEGVEWNETVAYGKLKLTAKSAAGYAFTSGNPVETIGDWTLNDAPCPVEPGEPTLDGSVATGTCDADSPWINFDVKLTDPENTVKNRAVSLVMTAGSNTETIELGDLKADGTLKGKKLWPGASVDADGKANGWPGWALVDGKWVETDGNFAWTRGAITAKLVVNPEVPVTISYPKATPECATGPKVTPPGGGEGGTATPPNGSGLASTGFAGTTIAIVAGIIVLAGAAFLVVARIRRKRA